MLKTSFNIGDKLFIEKTYFELFNKRGEAVFEHDGWFLIDNDSGASYGVADCSGPTSIVFEEL
jgi:uncharacterized protein YxjI